MSLLKGATLRRKGLRYATATRTAGNVPVTATGYVALDTALDLTLPAAPGDVIEITRNAQCDNAAIVLDWNVHFVNAAGALIRALSTGSAIGAWTVRGGDFFGSSAIAMATVQAGDVLDGNLRMRLMAKVGSAGTRVVFASTSSVPFEWYAKNLGPVAA